MESTRNCDETLADQADGDGDDEPARDLRGASIGRYLVVDTLGAGAMGIVYSAYDPELDRKVAVKLVHARLRESAAGHARLLREAQALARVSHPHVVSVHDVGSHDGHVFVAMEFVQGVTLTRWLQAAPRSWREVLDALLRAGRGLAAVHAAGLVHRDFKPDNVMVGDDGRVRVMDLGLARVGAEPDVPRTAADADALAVTGTGDTRMSTTGETGEPPSHPGGAIDRRLTRTGALLGTPAYMAPELYYGRGADARSDQFSLCVALYEALYGQHPFGGTTMHALVFAAMAGQLRPPPPGSRVPAWVQRAVQRGLAARPEDRWPDLPALLAALDRDPWRARRRALAAGGLALGLTAAVFAGTRVGADACSGGERQIAGVWDEGRREAAAAAFLATDLPYAATTWARVERDLDDFARAWAAMHRDACVAHQRGEQSSALLDLRMTCLEGQKQSLAALVDVFTAADPTTVEHAAQAGEQLGGLARCADLAALRARVAPPDDPGVVAEVDRVRARLARARAEQQTGQYTRGRELARAALLAANATGYRPVIAEAALVAGNLAHEVLDDVDARVHLNTAYFTALAARHERVALDAAIGLIYCVGDRDGDTDEAALWSRTAAALIDPVAGDDPAWLMLGNARGVLAHDTGRLRDAEQAYREVLARISREFADQPLRAASTRNNLGILLSDLGDLPGARAELTAALQLHEQQLGPAHPKLIETLSNLGGLATAEGHYDEAEALTARLQSIAEQAFPADSPRLVAPLVMRANLEFMRGRPEPAAALYRRALGLTRVADDHPERALLHNNLGSALQALHHHREAEAHLERALAIRMRSLGPEHPDVASVLANLGGLYDEMGQRPRAVVALRRALALQERVLGRDHTDLGYTLTNLGEVERAEGQYGDAERDLRRAVSVWERGLGPDTPLLAHPWSALGHLMLDRGEPQAALPLLEQALARTASTDPAERAELEFLVARALVGSDRDRALALARAAEPAARASDAALADEISAWLKEHAPKDSKR